MENASAASALSVSDWDGTYFSVIYDGAGQNMPILAVIGIDLEGKREVLGFSTGDRENQQAWEALLTDFKERGLADHRWWQGADQRD